MGKDLTSKTILGLVGLAIVGYGVYLVRDALPPFLIAFGLAMLLDPVLDRLERRGVSRGLAVALTFSVFLAVFITGIVVLLPLGFKESTQLVNRIPAAYEQVRAGIDDFMRRNITVLQHLRLPLSTEEAWNQYHREIAQYLQEVPRRIFSAFQASAARLIWIVIIPIVTLYMMVDIDRIRARAYHVVPEAHREVAVQIANKVAAVFGRYLRGLFVVCVGFGIVLGVVLWAFGLPYALLLALVGGVLYAVPYIGPLATIAIAALVAWATRGQPIYTIGIGVTVLVINQIFDQIVTPRVLGAMVGLHPILSIFALMVGGSLFGLIGMIFAVPLAASVIVVLEEFFPRLTEPLPTRGRGLWKRRARAPAPEPRGKPDLPPEGAPEPARPESTLDPVR